MSTKFVRLFAALQQVSCDALNNVHSNECWVVRGDVVGAAKHCRWLQLGDGS